MTILVCGASGLVGRDLCDLFDREHITYYGTYNNDQSLCERENMYKVDFTNNNDVYNFFNENKHKFLVCIFLVVQRVVDVCETDWNKIMKVNVNAVDFTSAICAKYGIYFIHLSTDYVFDGSNPPYFQSSTPNPLQNYGITKYMAELRVFANYQSHARESNAIKPRLSYQSDDCDDSVSRDDTTNNIYITENTGKMNYCIIRTPVLYTTNSISSLCDNAVSILSKNIMDLRTYIPKTEDDYYIRRPVFTPDLCVFIRTVAIIAIEGNETDKFSGIYHYYNPDNKFTKYQMTVKIADFLGISHNHISPVKNAGKAKRPYDTELCDIRYNIRNFPLSSFNDTISSGFSKFKHTRLGKYSNSVTDTITESIPNILINQQPTYFLMFDLDGTLVNTSYAHYRSYLEVLSKRNIDFMTYNEWKQYINYNNIHSYIIEIASKLANHDITELQHILSDIRNEKLECFRSFAITYVTPTKNCLKILEFIEKNNINAVVVTNSSSSTTDVIRSIVPELNKITKWCFRETYTEPKPHPESYNVAIQKYYKNETHIIGFENTLIGYESLRHSTNIVYIYVDKEDEYSNQDKWYYTKNAFLFDDYKQVLI
jgi:dTDP-4-dehydrorhamnose reductase/beta-phosphoglucomutase-like phosphatase (HAD superfamily)